MDIQIRAITLDDVENFHKALDDVARERRFLRLTEAPPLASTGDFVAGNIEHGNPQLVVIDDGRIVGWCDICRNSYHAARHVGSLGMGLVASHRGRGIGFSLITAAIAAAQPKFGRIELDVYETNLPAIALYEKVGFEHEGRRKKAIEIEGHYVDVLTMGMVFS